MEQKVEEIRKADEINEVNNADSTENSKILHISKTGKY